MNAAHRKRLGTLADFLEALPPRKFDIHRWWGSSKPNRWTADPEPRCGTVACALGWATTIPSFRRAGLRLSAGTPVLWRSSRGGGPPRADWCKASGVRAGAEFFGLGYDDACKLFLAEGYRSKNPRPKTVAKRLRQLAEEPV